MFVDGHERLDVLEGRKWFLRTIKDMEFRDGTMKEKYYSLDYAIGSDQCQPVIIITHNECIFSLNDGT